MRDAAEKSGRTGPLVFVKVRHELYCNDARKPALIEFHDIVYRQAKGSGDVEPPPLSESRRCGGRRNGRRSARTPTGRNPGPD